MAQIAVRFDDGVEAFLAWEAAQEMRYELVGGVVRAMAGGSDIHDALSTRMVARLLEAAAKRPGCRARGSNLKIRSPVGSVMYPDAFVRCGPRDDRATVVDDPLVVVEVLSPSTDQHDLTRKRWAYEAIPSLRAILLVDTEALRVEIATREPDGTWRSRLVEGREGVVELAVLDTRIPLAELYADTDLLESAA
jgi:Uma2 family endonuclease